ncbi:bifunctional aspartate kinase/homoserine dehydrogenase I [Saccharicrinis sp. FJH2]|uniref:bifunctional aspartate kinase/homoserine dehydrogenase I n=1 Tax=Saccharicrinis sp. FJH65 TaxID=3344659 RepID=UPI0035F4321E
MRVLKFGGTSVGSAENILRVKKIVEARSERIVVVVSAIGGVTDLLLETAAYAQKGDEKYLEYFEKLHTRHQIIIDELLSNGLHQDVKSQIDKLLDELKNIYTGVYLIQELSDRTSDIIVSYGERMSSIILASVLGGVPNKDARKFIKTRPSFGKNVVDFEITDELISAAFTAMPQLSVVPGFIASNTKGEITTLGRGGSDYTAAIIAAALEADMLEIWTDVDGFMTADPKVIKNAYPIEKLSYSEAMELSHFGAKVIYPPTIYPVLLKEIPVMIKNTINPEVVGTLISKERDSGKAIKGISSINDTCLITIQGIGMVGVIGINHRLFEALAKANISVFLVSQASSENSTSFAIKNADAEKAERAIRMEFAKEFEFGDINHIIIEKDLATIAIVGENMKHTPGIAGKLFQTLGKNGINVIACAQGASELNISFVIKLESLRKALNVIHESFFLSEYIELNLFMVGVGTVGSDLLQQLAKQQQKLKEEHQLRIRLVGISNSKKYVLDRNGIEISDYRKLLDESAKVSNLVEYQKSIIDLNMFNSVFVDCTASDAVAKLYNDLLKHNVHVVTANKVAASSAYDNYKELKSIAQRRGVKFLFETNVGAGLPIINTMNALMKSGDKIIKLEAVLSGTLNFIFNTLSSDIPLSKAILMAKQAGYSEPDPRIDLSGVDVIRKLVILSREAGYKVEQNDVQMKPFIPQDCFDGTLDEFWSKVSELDGEFEEKRKVLDGESKKWRYVATMENGSCSVELKEVGSKHPFYDLEGSNNIILITTERYNEYPMMIKGYGAGASVTAAGVFADIISIANP